MFDSVEKILKKKNVLSHKNQGITICSVENPLSGINLAAALLYEVVDKKTVLYLSGGSTPKTLYAKLAKEEVLVPGAVGMIDERFGSKYHPKSNELMIKDTGLLRYLEMINIPFYPILARHSEQSEESSRSFDSAQDDIRRKETAKEYDEKIREMNSVFPKSVAVLGIGTDGHTAGIPSKFNPPAGGQNSKFLGHELVTDYNFEVTFYGERVTMTFLGLEMMDLLIILAFGTDKKDALDAMFSDGSEQEIPARFYKRPEIARKTILITDLAV